MLNISALYNEPPNELRGELENNVYKVFKEIGIPFERVDNDPVESMDECIEISNKLGAEIRKSVFVCDRKKSSFYLVVLPAGKSFNTKVFCEKVCCPRVSFASAECMEEYLGVLPGSATIMGLLNDVQSKVNIIIDKEVASSEWFACNPGANTSHIKFRTQHLLDKFIPYTKHRAKIVEL